MVVSPSGLAARVRGIHAQNAEAAEAIAGQRCALNLAGDGVTREAIARGDVVLAPCPARADRPHRRRAPPPRRRGEAAGGRRRPARLHLGAAEVGVRVVPLDPPLAPGGTGFVQLVLDAPVAAAALDRFVLRDVSARRTIGGGRLLDLRAPARKRRAPERLALLAAARGARSAARSRRPAVGTARAFSTAPPSPATAR